MTFYILAFAPLPQIFKSSVVSEQKISADQAFADDNNMRKKSLHVFARRRHRAPRPSKLRRRRNVRRSRRVCVYVYTLIL